MATRLQSKSVEIDSTGIRFRVYGDLYLKAARALPSPDGKHFSPVSYQLYCQALELYFKAFVWLKKRPISWQEIKKKYGHHVPKLWKDSKALGIRRYASTTELRDRVIALVGPYYKERQFAYLDLDMIFHGYRNLYNEPRALATLDKLCAQLSKSLRDPIFRAAQPGST